MQQVWTVNYDPRAVLSKAIGRYPLGSGSLMPVLDRLKAGTDALDDIATLKTQMSNLLPVHHNMGDKVLSHDNELEQLRKAGRLQGQYIVDLKKQIAELQMKAMEYVTEKPKKVCTCKEKVKK